MQFAPKRWNRAALAPLLVGIAVGTLLLTGCVDDDQPEPSEDDPWADASYDTSDEAEHAASLNGSDVLARMFQDSGYEVELFGDWHSALGGRFDDDYTTEDSTVVNPDILVWFSDSFQCPSNFQIERIKRWLEQGDGARTAIYIGRDFDAEPLYWKKVISQAEDEEDRKEIERRRKKAKRRFLQERAGQFYNISECDWFSLRDLSAARSLSNLEGAWMFKSYWDGNSFDSDEIEMVNAKKTEIYAGARLEGNERKYFSSFSGNERLLYSDRDTLVGRTHLDESEDREVIYIVNGSFLMNMPLVNQEHRKLANMLIAEVEANVGSDKKVYFVDERTATLDMMIETLPPNGEEQEDQYAFLTTPPLSDILIHLAIAGILFAFYRWPIFGRPRDPKPTSLSDFDKHITALGELLRRTGDRTFAIDRLRHYHQTVNNQSLPVEKSIGPDEPQPSQQQPN